MLYEEFSFFSAICNDHFSSCARNDFWVEYMHICMYIYGDKNIVLLLVPRVDSDK